MIRPPLGPLILACILALAWPAAAMARVLWSDEAAQAQIQLNSALEGLGLLAAPPVGSQPGQEGGRLGFGRLRLESIWKVVPGFEADAAYDNRLGAVSSGGAAAFNVLPSSAPSAFRVWQLSGTPFQDGHTTDFQELSRAFIAVSGGPWSLTLGRQAIGWGRGLLFSAVDLFAPTAPTEIDREWRRGVDALNLDRQLGERSSLNLVSAWGPSWDQSALGLRLRGFVGQLDAEALIAKRAEDRMAGFSSSMALGGAEIHAEGALYLTPGGFPANSFLGRNDLVPKAVLGLSNNFDVGSGLAATLEYHYSGFGAPDMVSLQRFLADPAYQNRYLRGDSQIALRQAGALVLSTQLSPSWTASFEVLQSLVDSSGLLAPFFGWELSDTISLSMSGFVGYGLGVQEPPLQGQFGGTPTTLMLEAKFYD